MKKIEVKGEVTNYLYEAIDGTRFNDEKECLKYDTSARAILFAKYNKFIINDIENKPSEYEIFNTGGEEYCYDIVKVDTQEKADCIKQLYAFVNPNMKEENYIKNFDKVDEALKKQDFVFIGRGLDCDNFDGFYICYTLNGLIDRIKSFCEPIYKQ